MAPASNKVNKKNSQLLSIVMPAFNEGEVIEKTVKSIHDEVAVPYELLIVYDFAQDTTVPAVKKVQAKYKNVELVKNIYNKGALNAIKTGFVKASGYAVCVMMADLTDDPRTLNLMFEKYKQGYDIVSGSRYMPGGHQVGGPFIKQLMSRAAGISLHYIAGIPTFDPTNSFRLYSQRFLKKTKIESNGGFELGIELTVKAYFGGYKVTEVPTTWIYLAKVSRFNMKKWLPKYIKWYFWAINKRLNGYPK